MPAKLRSTAREAVVSGTRRPIRLLLTALGTILGVGAYVATSGSAASARAQVSTRFDRLKATEVRLVDTLPALGNPFPPDSAVIVEELNGVVTGGVYASIPSIDKFSVTKTIGGVDGVSAPLIMAESQAIEASIPNFAAGRPYDKYHEDSDSRVTILGASVAEELGVKSLRSQPVVWIEGVPFVVVAIIDQSVRMPELTASVIIPLSSANETFETDGASFEMLVEVEPGAAQLVARQTPLALRPDVPERIQAIVTPEPSRLRGQISSDVQNLFLSLSLISLAIGSLAIANATLVNVMERRSEIGLRRALGARRRDIRRQIALEAGIVGVIGGFVGASLGVLTTVAICRSRGWSVVIDPPIVFGAPLVGLAAGLVAGVIPAIRAGRTEPAEALRS